MLSDADELYLRITFRRLDAVCSAAGTTVQRRGAGRGRDRVTAALHAKGWALEDIACAAGVTPRVAAKWVESGRATAYLSLPVPPPCLVAADQLSHQLSVPEVADRLGVSEKTVLRWIRSGRLPASRRHPTRASAWRVDARLLREERFRRTARTVREFAEEHGVLQPTVRVWVRRGLLPAVQVVPGGHLRIPAGAKPPHPPHTRPTVGAGVADALPQGR